MSTDIFLQICSAVEKLGGEVSKKGMYDSSATHMIAGKVGNFFINVLNFWAV